MQGIRAATYSRVSTRGQVEYGFSLAEQKASLLAYCQAKGMIHVEHVVDPGVSGKKADRRAVARIEELVAARLIDIVVCSKVDRLTRTAWFGEKFVEEMADCGIPVIFTDQHFEPGPIGNFTRGVMFQVAELDHAMTVEKLVKGKLQKAKDKQVMPVNGAPYGYRQVTVAMATALPEYAGRSGELLVEEDEAAIVREIFRRFVGGQGLAEIGHWLNADPVASRKTWSFRGIKWLLRHPAYRGETIYNRRAWRDGNAIAEKPASEQIGIPCPALVTLETWQAAQALLAAQARNVGRPSTDYLLRGIVFCGNCKGKQGQPLRCCGFRKVHDSSRPSYRESRQYKCNASQGSFGVFCGATINATELEKSARRKLLEILRPGALGQIARERAEADLAETGGLEVEVANLEVQLQQLDKEENKVLDLALSGFTPRLIEGRLKPIQERRKQLQEQLSGISGRLGSRQRPDEAAEHAERIAALAREDFESAEAAGDIGRMRAIYGRFLTVTIFGSGKRPRFQVVIPG